MANEPPSLPPLIDNPLAPEFFADEATGFFIHQGNVSITFSSARVVRHERRMSYLRRATVREMKEALRVR